MIRSLFITLILALPTLAAETGAEIAKVAEIIHRANVAHDAGTVSKWVTADFYSINTQGILLNHDKAIESVKAKSSPPADLKFETIKIADYGDTALQLLKETFTAADGTKMEVYLNEVFVMRDGQWKLASRTASVVAPRK
jgi:ketosteroid isomerase-like protein